MELEDADITELLQQWSGGDPAAFDRLLPFVYAELRRLAGSFLRFERSSHTLPPTALVHELYLKLVDQQRAQWTDREHFFRISARLMRRIMVDHARRRASNKRGNAPAHLPLDDALDAPASSESTLLAVDAALTRFSAIDPRASQIVEMRYFGGFELEEIATLLRISRTTVKRQWNVARMWLHRDLASEFDGSGRRESV